MGRPDRIPVKCPNCGTGLRAPLQFAGKRAKCRVCGSKVPVPELVENVVADPVIEAEALDDDATEMMSVEELEPEFAPQPAPKLPPRDEPEPEEDDEEEERPRPRPKRRNSSRVSNRKKNNTTLVILLSAGAGLVFLALAFIGIYFALSFGSTPKPTDDTDSGSSTGTPAATDAKPPEPAKPKDTTPLRPTPATKLVGMWSAFDQQGNQWHYSFGKNGAGSVRIIQLGDIVTKPFRFRLFSNNTDYELAIDVDGEAGTPRVSVTFPAENQIQLSKRHRFNAATQKIEPEPQSVLLTRSE